jgi:hypothetical protein
MLCALIKNSVVVELKDITEEEISLYRDYEMVLEIENLSPVPEVGWLWNGISLTTPEGQPAVTSKRLTKLKFAERFTSEELAAIEAFAWQSNTYAAILRANLRKQMIANYIDLALPETVAGIMALVSLGLLTQARANEIVGAPVTEKERYRGEL